jgi:chromosome segregation ATPase
LVATITSGQIALSLIGVGATLLGVLLGHRSATRKANADAHLADAQAEHTVQETYQEWISDQRAVNDDLRAQLTALTGQMGDLRDSARAAKASAAEAKLEAARARTDKAEAEQHVAELEAELARSLKDAGDDRHAMQSDIRTLEAKLKQKDIEIADLREEVDTLKARMGVTERRST